MPPLVSSPSRRRGLVRVAAIALVLALLYLARLVVLDIASREGDVPPASSLQLPEGSTVLAEDEHCGSGGCWLELQIRPPEGMTPSELAVAIGATGNGGRVGTWWDPRSISFSSEPRLDVLDVQLGYWR